MLIPILRLQVDAINLYVHCLQATRPYHVLKMHILFFKKVLIIFKSKCHKTVLIFGVMWLQYPLNLMYFIYMQSIFALCPKVVVIAVIVWLYHDPKLRSCW